MVRETGFFEFCRGCIHRLKCRNAIRESDPDAKTIQLLSANPLALSYEKLVPILEMITHHTVSGKNLTGPGFLRRKDSVIAALDHEIRHGDLDRMAAIRQSKRTL